MDLSASGTSRNQGTSSISQDANPLLPVSEPTSATTPAEHRPIRFSARVRAAKEKAEVAGRGSETTTEQPASAGPSRETRNSKAASTAKAKSSSKGKGKEVFEIEESIRALRRSSRQAATHSLTINEPERDPKGKKRAISDLNSDDDDETPGPSTKRQRKSRSAAQSAQYHGMPKKSRSSTSKGKGATKAVASASSSRLEDNDVEMLDAEFREEFSDSEDHVMGMDEDTAGQTRDNGGEHDEDGGSSPPAIPGSISDASAMSIFGDYRQFGSYMMSLSSRLKTMLNNIKLTADPMTRLLTLQELSELLSISTEDTLAGSFPVEQFVKALVRILGGRDRDDDGEENGDNEDGEQDEDAALAAALAMSTGNDYPGDDNLECQVLACRCLANLMEALPGVAHTIVYHGAIPVLCSKLIEISYIDLAEQTLSTMEKISEEFPSAIVREGGLAALLNYLDFFSIAVQRTALQAASNCCRNIAPDHFQMIMNVWPIIRSCLSYSDQRLVEFACLCVIRVVESYHRSSTDNLELLVDAELIKAIHQLLLPAGGSPLVAASTYTQLLRALATAARASAKITVSLLEADVVVIVYQILTGVLPSFSTVNTDQGGADNGQGLGGGLADMTIMENLAHRPKDQIEETLSLISELMPPLLKDGVFDHKAYTEKGLAKMAKAKAKAERTAMRLASQVVPTARTTTDVQDTPTSEDVPEATLADAQPDNDATPAVDRIELLRSKVNIVARFMQLVVPILIDVYTASVISTVRVKSLTALLKAISFLDSEGLQLVLDLVPVSSFASSILSSKDHPSLIIGALQLVELLLAKSPAMYKSAFRREGVFHEIESLAAREVLSKKDKSDKEAVSDGSSETSHTAPVLSGWGIPGFKKLTSLSLEPEDAITFRARAIRLKYLAPEECDDADATFQTLRQIVDCISKEHTSENALVSALDELSELFESPQSSVSSFELLQSGVIDGLLGLTTDYERSVGLSRRRALVWEAFTQQRTSALHNSTIPLVTLVKKLQESLTRMESFDVITVSQGSDDSKRSSPSLLARQLRLRLVAEDESDVPRSLHNIVVSIHAIATFHALNDYLRPRVSGILASAHRSQLQASASPSINSSANVKPHAESSKVHPTATSDSNNGPTDEQTPSNSASSITRRRSQRLKTKTTGENNVPIDGSTENDEEHNHDPDEAQLLQPTEALDELTDDELDGGLLGATLETDEAVADKTVNLSVLDDGSKIEAQTPDGTRVATPNPHTSAGISKQAQSRTSYAAALKAKPADWHLEFFMDDSPLPLDLTIYGAIHQHEMRKRSGPVTLNLIWQGVYTVKFKRVPGPLPSESESDDIRGRASTPPLSSLPEDASHTKILRLLRVLYHINVSDFDSEHLNRVQRRNLPDSAFVNNKLSAKLTRQLEEPMIVASSCLPDWALDLPSHFPFLFPFATRYNFLQSTSFGYARLILRWQSQQTRGSESSRRDDGIGFLGRLQRQKVRISRKHVLESAMKVFELYGSSSSILEVEYFEEVGTGLGPTLEFYSLVSKEFTRKDLKVWRDSHHPDSGVYVHHPAGLYPAPINAQELEQEGGLKRIHIFKVIGQFVAKALLDSRIVDMSFNKVFLRLVLGEEVAPTLASLKSVDSGLASSLRKIQDLKSQKDKAPQDAKIEDLAIDFTIPGYDIELKTGGRDIAVTSENVDEYIEEVLDAILGRGVSPLVKAFRDGFSKVFPINDLRTFSVDELVMLFGNGEEDWSIETLTEAVKADHGYHSDSKAIHDLLEIMSQYDSRTRRSFLQFITGSPKLPIGGFRGLTPPFTVVRKPHEAPLTADDYLPSVMTCVNYLKLPEYSSKSIMKEKLRLAMLEGVGSFHLS